MNKDHLWNRAAETRFQLPAEVVGGFNVGFDPKIPEKTKDFLMDFVYWAEDRFLFPVTLWVDFKYRHYLRNEEGKQVSSKFYWVDFAEYPVLKDPDDIPVIELPVRLERREKETLLRDFIQAISRYFAWLTNSLEEYQPDEQEIAAILQAYLER